MEATRKKTTTFNIVMVGLSAALICIAGPFAIPIPFSPVPISLIPLAIFICAFLLDWKLCGLSYVIFLLLGMVGLPVFSGFSGGLAKLAGPTGGYLIGFIFTALVTGFFINKFNKIYMYVIGMIFGHGVWVPFRYNMVCLPARYNIYSSFKPLCIPLSSG